MEYAPWYIINWNVHGTNHGNSEIEGIICSKKSKWIEPEWSLRWFALQPAGQTTSATKRCSWILTNGPFKKPKTTILFLVDVELHYDQAPLVCICIYIYLYLYTWLYIQWGATSVKQEMLIFRGTRTSAGWCPLLHAYCWKKVWLSEVPCQHTTSSQHARACLIALETTSNTARGIFRAIPCGLCHRIPVLPQWEALLCSKSLFYHNGSVPEILLLENIILSPTGVSKEPCHSGSVSASSCSWLFLVSMFPLASKWHKLPPPFLVGFPVIHLAWPEVQLCATIIAKS